MRTAMWLFQTLIDTSGSQGHFNFYTNILFDFDSSFNEKTEQLFRHTLRIPETDFAKVTAEDLEGMYKEDYQKMSQSQDFGLCVNLVKLALMLKDRIKQNTLIGPILNGLYHIQQYNFDLKYLDELILESEIVNDGLTNYAKENLKFISNQIRRLEVSIP